MNIEGSSSSFMGANLTTRNTQPTTSPAPETSLSEQELKELRQLQTRDKEVKSHEAAHIAAGGVHVKGGANFSFQKGPDGVQYAVSGEVNIDTAKVNGNPQATLEKAEQIQAAALAPLQPSSQDRAVAAQAAKIAIEARAELSQQANVEDKQSSSPPNAFSVRIPTESNLLDLTA